MQSPVLFAFLVFLPLAFASAQEEQDERGNPDSCLKEAARNNKAGQGRDVQSRNLTLGKLLEKPCFRSFIVRHGWGGNGGPPLRKPTFYAMVFMSTRLEAKSHSILIRGSGRV